MVNNKSIPTFIKTNYVGSTSSVDTFYANIYVGFKDVETETIYSIKMVEQICQEYVDRVGLCVTVTPASYIYNDGNEPGAIVGLINYPRFPSTEEDIRRKAILLAIRLKDELKQHRVSIMMPDETLMLGEIE